jgi:ABC-2 type transport system ATP-binding protein
MPAVIELKHVTKNYGSNTALSNVSLEMPPGVVFALLGENGAGKTTAIRLMLGLTEPTQGDVRVLGLDSRHNGLAVRSRVGYLPERATLYEWMTAAEIGWFTAGFYADGFEQQFRTLVSGFRVPLDRKLNQLSKGMRAKIALSLAIAHQPELLILDEPTSGLDTMVRREFLESIFDGLRRQTSRNPSLDPSYCLGVPPAKLAVSATPGGLRLPPGYFKLSKNLAAKPSGLVTGFLMRGMAGTPLN